MGTSAQARVDPAWVYQLLEPEAYPHAVGKIQLIETHISWVFLTGDFVYKVKKPVDFGFVDFTSLSRRRHFCEEELRLNRRTAGDFYLDVVPIALVGGKPRIGAEPAVEYAVKMRQFSPDARLDRCLAAGRVSTDQVHALALLVASFHRRLPPLEDIPHARAAQRAVRPALGNFEHIEGDHISDVSRGRIARIKDWTMEQAGSLAPFFRARAAGGFVRECHGDLHLANLFLHDGVIYPFDCLEFNTDFRWIDQASDVSFLVMDLMARGRTDLAYLFLNTWLEESGDYEGLSVLRFYLVYRCMVRLKVASIQAEQLHEDARGEHAIKARHYLDLAEALMEQPARPKLVLMHGFSASGKTWTSSRLAQALPAIRVRSDLERKRLHGVPRRAHAASGVGEGLYASDATDATYRVLERHCETGLRNGFHMIADATFLDRDFRRRFLDLARRLGAQPVIFACGADPDTLRRRIRERQAAGTDESDAGPDVLARQMEQHDPLDQGECALTVRSIGELA